MKNSTLGTKLTKNKEFLSFVTRKIKLEAIQKAGENTEWHAPRPQCLVISFITLLSLTSCVRGVFHIPLLLYYFVSVWTFLLSVCLDYNFQPGLPFYEGERIAKISNWWDSLLKEVCLFVHKFKISILLPTTNVRPLNFAVIGSKLAKSIVTITCG